MAGSNWAIMRMCSVTTCQYESRQRQAAELTGMVGRQNRRVLSTLFIDSRWHSGGTSTLVTL
jgi:hypothetical protein